MQSVFSAKSVLAVAVALGSLAAATGARAQGIGDAVVSVTVGAPMRHAPVVVQPAPVYVQPAPVYAQPRYVQAPAHRADPRGPWGDADRDGIPNRYDRRDDRYERHDRRDDRRYAMNSPWGDADRDGVPNRYDRAPYDPRFR